MKQIVQDYSRKLEVFPAVSDIFFTISRSIIMQLKLDVDMPGIARYLFHHDLVLKGFKSVHLTHPRI